MTVPAILYAHKHITEREGAHRWPDGRYDNSAWEDCTWCSGVEFARLTLNPAIAATHAEAELLRAASGEDTGSGSNEFDLKRGFLKRYKKDLGTPIYGFANLWAALTPGKVAIVGGSMGGFPVGHPLRRFDPGFAGAHRVLVARYSASDLVWWCNPLAPQGTGYLGEVVTKSDLYRFVHQINAGQFVGRIIPKPVIQEVVEVQAPITDTVAKLMDVPAGATLYELDGIKVIKKLLNAYPGRPSPYAAGKRAMYATIAGVNRLVLVAPVSNIRAVPDTTPFTQSQVDAASAAAASKATSTEKSRLRGLLGL